MEFRKYNSLENHYRDKFINAIVESGNDGGEWVALEKIHGANFSFWYDGEELKYAKRSGFCDDTFFSCYIIVEKYGEAVKRLYDQIIGEELKKLKPTLVVYGEIFGGNFFGDSTPNAKCIQAGVDYHPDVEFAAFDIAIDIEEGVRVLSFNRMQLECEKAEMPMVPTVYRGTFANCLEHDNDFHSLVPASYGLTVPQDKKPKAEGLVLRPATGERFLSTGKRCIIKSKNATFAEKENKAKPRKAPVPLSDDANLLMDDLLRFITESRVAAVQSKIGEPSFKMIQQVTGLTLQDAIEDYDKEGEDVHIEPLKTLVGDEWKRFNSAAMTATMQVVRQYYLKVIDTSN